MGADSVHPKILNECRYELAELLCSLKQNSLDKGEIPEDWKCANITTIHKKDAKSDPNNYRLVSLTSVCCKIMEKVIRRHLLRQNNILSDKQYGFLPGQSTTLQLFKALDDWTAELDKGYEVDIVYIDFQKAFDSVPQKKLLNTISKYGIKGKTLNWIPAFLTDRMQRVAVNESFLKWAPVVSGVPQGSVLGPILFLLYINSMLDGITSPMLLYADDAKIFRSITDAIQEENYNLTGMKSPNGLNAF